MTPTLPFTEITRRSVEARDVEALVNEVYADRVEPYDEYNVAAELELTNDSYYTFTAQRPEDLYDFEQEELGKFRSGSLTDWSGEPKTWPQFEILIADLVSRGHIESGSYLMSVSW